MRLGLRGGRRVHRPPVPAARLRRRVGRAAALGRAHPRPGAGRAEATRATPAPTCSAATPPAAGSIPTARVHTGIVERPRAEWPVLIHDHHPGYISWDDYLANEARLAANRTNAGARPPREGSALCQGIIGCGACGRPMCTRYHRDSDRPTSAPPAPTGSPRRPAGRSPRPPWTTRWPNGCWPR